MYSALPERCAKKWLVGLVDEARTTFWGIIEQSVSESSKAAGQFQFFTCDSRRRPVKWHAQRGSWAVAKEVEGRKRYWGVARPPSRLPVLHGSLVASTLPLPWSIPCQKDTLAAEERRRAFSVMMLAAARQQSKPLPLPEKKRKGPDWPRWLVALQLSRQLSGEP